MSTRDLGSVTAYSIAVKYGFEGTEAEWMQAILNAGESAQDAAESAQEASNSATSAENSATSAEESAEKAKIQFGSPLVAHLVSDMEDENRVYVYVGEETGYTAGNWYYYDGSEWTSGGVYNGEGVNTDPSLSIEDMPADAKAVGDEIADVRADLSYIQNDVGLLTDYGFDWSETSNGITVTKNHNAVKINGNRSGSYGYYPLSEAYQLLTSLTGYSAHSLKLTAGKRYELVVILKSGSLNRTSGDTTFSIYDNNNKQVSVVYADRNISEGVIRTGGSFVATSNLYSIILFTANNQFSNALYEIYIREYEHDELTDTFYGTFLRGNLASGVYSSSYYYRVATDTIMSYDRPLFITIQSGYRLGLHYFNDNDVFVSDSGWKTGTIIVPAGKRYKAMISLANESTPRPYAYVPDYVNAVKISTYTGQNLIESVKINDRLSVLEFPFRQKRYYSHIGLNQPAANVVIPNQSIFDVARTKRLGFDAMELNVHKTSDNHYICIHGNSQKWGDLVYSTDSTDISNVSIGSYSLNDVKTKVRFKSKYDKYKIAPNTLEEILHECKKQGIIPIVQYRDNTEVAIIDNIMGKNNYLLLIYAQDRETKTDAPCVSWLTLTDPNAIIAKCKDSGKTYICALDVSNSAYNSFTDSDWIALVNAIHSAGFMLGFAGVYAGEEKSQKMFGYGFDVSASGWNIPELEYGNICNLDGGLTFTDFETNGTVTNYCISLSDDQTVKPIFPDTESSLHSESFLGGGCLHVRFSGTLQVVLGTYIYQEFTSDGSAEMVFSSYFDSEWPGFVLTSNGNTTIYDISYKASNL